MDVNLVDQKSWRQLTCTLSIFIFFTPDTFPELFGQRFWQNFLQLRKKPSGYIGKSSFHYLSQKVRFRFAIVAVRSIFYNRNFRWRLARCGALLQMIVSPKSSLHVRANFKSRMIVVKPMLLFNSLGGEEITKTMNRINLSLQ